MTPFYNLSNISPDKVFSIDSTGRITSYSQISSFSDEISSVITPRSLIFVLCENTIECLIGVVSFINNGVVPLLLNTDIKIEILNNLITQYTPEYIFLPKHLLCFFDNYINCYSIGNFTLLKSKFKNQELLPDELALLLTTSGSTGSSKFVRLSYKNLRSNGESIIKYLNINSCDRAITTLPMNYSYGFSIINSHLIAESSLLLSNKSIVEKEFWDFFRTNHATSFSGVPFTFEMLNRMRFTQWQLPSLRTITQAGGRLSRDVLLKFAQYANNYNINFFVMYGQTEASPRISYLPPSELMNKLGSIGIAIPGGEISLVDNCGLAIDKSDCEGELIYKGPNVSLGYAECRHDLYKSDDNEGLLRTGDLAYRDSDGYYFITGRSKRFIKIYGNRINLDETEILLKEVVSDCACTGIDDRMFVYITDKNKKNFVRNYLANLTKLNFKAFVIYIIEKIPRTESGKINYRQLENLITQSDIE